MSLRAIALVAVVAVSGCAASLPPKIAVTVENDLQDATVCDVFLRQSKHAAAGWGTDWMDREEMLAAGTARSFQLDPGLTWDVRLVSCVGTEIGERRNMRLDAPTTLPASSVTP